MDIELMTTSTNSVVDFISINYRDKYCERLK